MPSTLPMLLPPVPVREMEPLPDEMETLGDPPPPVFGFPTTNIPMELSLLKLASLILESVPPVPAMTIGAEPDAVTLAPYSTTTPTVAGESTLRPEGLLSITPAKPL